MKPFSLPDKPVRAFPASKVRQHTRLRDLALSFLLTITLLTTGTMFAAVHYVDFSAGLDTNNGTSKTTPWQHAPGMHECTSNCSSYTPAPGDQIILKGGVRWTHGTLPWLWTWTGSSSNPLYVGVDATWYTGTNNGTVNTSGTTVVWRSGNAFQMNGAWAGGTITINGANYTVATVNNPSVLTLKTSAGNQTGVSYSNSLFVRPIIDAEGLTNSGTDLNPGTFVTFDSIEFTGLMISTGSDYTITAEPSNGHVILSNLDVHNWRRCLGSGNPTSFCSSAMTTNLDGPGGIYFAGYSGLVGTGDLLQNSNVGSPEGGGNIGSCTRWMQGLVGDYIHDCTGACLHGCSLVHDNILDNVGNDFTNCTEHGNGLYSDGFSQGSADIPGPFNVYIYNNWIRGVRGCANATAIYPNPGTSGVANDNVTYYVFNNVVAGPSGSDIADEIDPYGGSSGQPMNVYDWNNTYVMNASGTCVNTVSRGIMLNIVDVRNLHCIPASGGTAFNGGSASHAASSNLLLASVSTANAEGYSYPSWTPTSGSAPTVGTGTNLNPYCSGALAPLCQDTTLGGTRTPSNRPSTGAWDIGAFQYNGSSSSVSPPTGLAAVVN